MRCSAWPKVLIVLLLGTPLGCATTADSTTLPPVSQIGSAKGTQLAAAARTAEARKAVAVDAKQYEADFKLARILERRNQPQRAKQAYQMLLQRNPSDGRVYHRLGVLAAREGHLDQAEQYLQQAQRLGLSSAELLADLGYLYYLQHRLDAAEQYLQQALKADPGHKRAAVNLGLVLGSQGKFDKALAMFRRSGDDATAYANLAYVCTQLGEMDRAIRYYDQALSLNKDLRPAAEALAQLGQRKRLLKQQRAKLARAARRNNAGSARPAVAVAPSRAAGERKTLGNTMLVGFTRRRAESPQPAKPAVKKPSASRPAAQPAAPKTAGQPPAQASVSEELWGTSLSSDVGNATDLPFGLEP